MGQARHMQPGVAAVLCTICWAAVLCTICWSALQCNPCCVGCCNSLRKLEYPEDHQHITNCRETSRDVPGNASTHAYQSFQ